MTDLDDTAEQSAADWQRLDPRMLVVYPLRELARFLPILLGIFVAGSVSGAAGEWWNLVGLLIPISLGLVRYWTTAFRIAGGRVELRHGLVNRHLLSTPLDRVRTVDVTAPLVHRLLGLTSVRVGTGTASTDDDEQIVLDGVPVEVARQLRRDLLSTGSPTAPETVESTILELDPAWVRFAPFTTAGLAIAGGAVAVAAQAVNTVGGFERIDAERLARDAERWSPWIAVPSGAVVLVLVVSVLSVGGYLVSNWGFRLTHHDGAWHLRRGLLTTRETTIDDARLRGVSVGEPLTLRLAGGGRASAIATGLARGDSSVLVPPAPRAVVAGTAGAVLHPSLVEAPLTDHGPRARRRRYTRAVVPASVLALVSVPATVHLDLPTWVPALALLTVPVAIGLAADRAQALGHALVEGHLVVRSGSLDRRRDALDVAAVIGWNLRASWFQRRAGLTTLVATTAGGRQQVTALDLPVEVAVALAGRAHPHLLDQFLTDPAAPTAPVRERSRG